MSAHLVNHVAFWVPTFIPIVPIDLHELLEDRTVATGTLRCKARGIMEVAVHVIFMFVVRVLGSENRWADRTRKMLDMVFFVCAYCVRKGVRRCK